MYVNNKYGITITLFALRLSSQMKMSVTLWTQLKHCSRNMKTLRSHLLPKKRRLRLWTNLPPSSLKANTTLPMMSPNAGKW